MSLSRREFIKRGALMSVVGVGAPAFLVKGAYSLAQRDASHAASAAATVSSAASASAAQNAAMAAVNNATNNKRILVVIQLTGGNDGLDTVIPYGQASYYNFRNVLAVPKDKVLDLDGKVGLSPNLPKLKQLYDGGNLALIQGVGYPNPNRSHFRSMEIWQTAMPDTIGDTGWLGRYLDASAADDQAARDKALRAINVGQQLPKTFYTNTTLVPSIASFTSYAFQGNTRYPSDTQAQIDVINKVYQEASKRGSYEDYIRQAAIDAMGSSDTLKRLVSAYQPKAQYDAKSQVAQGLKMVSQMIGGGLDTQIYYLTTGGYDTHANELNTHNALMKTLDDGIWSFMQDMIAQGRANDVMIMTFSEFGRRVQENASGGTDHGTAAPMFLVGGNIRGGVYGDHPSLDDLDQGDLKFHIDFRSVYGSVLRNWFGADPTPVVGSGWPNVNFLKS